MQLKEQKTGGQSRLARMSKVAALAKGTAKMAKNIMLIHQIESELETEIEKDKNRPKPTSKIGKLRLCGERLLHGKHVLLTIVILNVIDCLLVLGELMLDIKYVTDLLSNEYKRSEEFIDAMKPLYPARLGYLSTYDIDHLQHEILLATLTWNGSHTETDTANTSENDRVLSEVQNTSSVPMTSSTLSTRGASVRKRRSSVDDAGRASSQASASRYSNDPSRSVEVKVVQGLHKTSITILIILVLETTFKIFCFGKQMLKYKLECFDGFVVISSFIVDVVFIKGLQQFTVQEYILILAFIVPWRIIRVVNSLVVAINCHEHFRLVIVYKETKKISKELKAVKQNNKSLEACIDLLVKLCVNAGLPEKLVKSKLDLHRNAKQRSTVKERVKDTSDLHNNIQDIKNFLSIAGKSDTITLDGYMKEFEDGNENGGDDYIVVRL